MGRKIDTTAYLSAEQDELLKVGEQDAKVLFGQR
jgi:hypothetical protein